MANKRHSPHVYVTSYLTLPGSMFFFKNLHFYIFFYMKHQTHFHVKSEHFFFFFTFSFLYMEYISSHPCGTSTSHIPAQISVCQRPSPTTVPEFLDYLGPISTWSLSVISTSYYLHGTYQ